MSTDDQTSVIEYMRDPATHGLPPDGVDVIETHAAMIFLTGDRAWKMKKSIRLPYLDFSNLARRESACRREIELNRPGAPEIYVRVEPVTRDAAGMLHIGGDGTTVEWLVAMNRFPGDALLSDPARLAMLDRHQLDDLATAIAALHSTASPGPRNGGAARIKAVADDILASFGQAADLIGADTVATLGAAFDAAWQSARRTLDVRARIGLVRRCHGDLHLGNIVELEGRPIPFDALEFDDELATTDTLYDLAFLLADLIERNRRDAANQILNRYLTAAGSLANYCGLGCLPPFIACRIMVRVRVAIDRLRQSSGPPGESASGLQEKLEDACTILRPAPPALVAVGGLSGSGKTTLARSLAPLIGRVPGAVHVRSDVERKLLAGIPETQKLPPESYTPEAAKRVYARMIRKARLALSAGQSVVIDAVHLKPEERDEVAHLAGTLGVPFRGLWANAGEDLLVDRVEARAAKRRDASDATADVVRFQLDRDPGEIDWTRIDSSGPKERTLGSAVEALTGIVPPGR